MKRNVVKQWIGAAAVVVLLCTGISCSSSSTAETIFDPLVALLEGNNNFIGGILDNLVKMSSPAKRTELAAGQKPYAIIVDCSDSRLAPEIIFDKGLGELFVVRVAGNVVAPHELGSIEYAAEHLGAEFVMVLGHSKCGAVTAAVDATGPVEGNIGSLIESIAPAVERAKGKATASTTHAELVELAVDENVNLVAQNIVEQSPVVKDLLEKGKIKIVKAKYDLASGKVNVLPN